jgi:hypothetical protein
MDSPVTSCEPRGWLVVRGSQIISSLASSPPFLYEPLRSAAAFCACTLVGSLGRYSRVPEPLVFCTELVAFFKRIGWSFKGSNQRSGTEDGKEEIVAKRRYYGFQRTDYGMVKIRTDGERLVVSTNSGKDDMKEAYAYQRDEHGEPVASQIRAI